MNGKKFKEIAERRQNIINKLSEAMLFMVIKVTKIISAYESV